MKTQTAQPQAKAIALYLVIGLVLASLSSPLVKWLIQNGGKLGLQHPNAISFCNVLFTGNLAASLIILFTFGAGGIVADFKATQSKSKLLLLAGGLLAVLYPALIFTALETTTVTNVVLLSRFEVIMYALFSFAFVKTRLSSYEMLGYLIIAIGIGVLVGIGNNWELTQGDYYVLGSGLVHGVAVIVSKSLLKSCSLRLFVFSRNFLSAIIFYWLAVYLYGAEHFMDAFRGELWVVMAAYAIVAIVLAQFAWYKGLEDAPAKLVSNISFLPPFVTIFFAFLILGENPNLSQWLAMVIILAGMLLSKIKKPDKQELVLGKSLAGV